ncbi:MAG TPA: HAD family phosphatase [Patescibacteria group bacterium]|nr:HAD family phosphatase [Patescibacteria group bacterium]
MLRAIIFDMDGVLLKSEGAISKSFNMALNKYGVKLGVKDKKKYLGRSLRDQMEMWKEEYPQIPKDLDATTFGKEALDYQIEILKEILIPNKTILDLIKKVKIRNIKIAVATSSSKNRARMFLKLLGLLSQLDVLITSEDVKRHKPYPDIFLEAAKRIGVLSKNCVVIEDAVNGIKAANSAEMKSVALLTRHHSREDFFEADYIFSDFKSLSIKDLDNLFKK